MNLMLISGCVEYHVLIYERCKIHPSEFGRDYGMQDCLQSLEDICKNWLWMEDFCKITKFGTWNANYI